MTKPPPPEGYRDWCEFRIRAGLFEKRKAGQRVFGEDVSMTNMAEMSEWALSDYAALRDEVERLRKLLPPCPGCRPGKDQGATHHGGTREHPETT